MRTHAGITHPGIRPVNEDCFGIFPVGKAAYLYAVCDGVGGCAGGQTASSLALSSFSNFILSELDSSSVADPDALPLAQIKRIMRAAASHASHTVRTAGLNDPTLTDMASTLVAALVTATRAYVLHVGDSRLYTVTSDTVEKVTRDHSYLQYLIDVGRVTPRQANELKIENYITQAIGVYDYVDGDFCALDLSTYPPDTYLLLCSDGLYRTVRKPQMQAILLSPDTVEQKARTLLSAALDGGSEDNVTALILSLGGR